MTTITDHEFVPAPPHMPEYTTCWFVYRPDNPDYDDPSGGWMMGGPIECGNPREQHKETRP